MFTPIMESGASHHHDRQPGVNFNNILQAFCTKLFCTTFFSLHVAFFIFWQKNISSNAICKMLVKLTTGVYFTNRLQAHF